MPYRVHEIDLTQPLSSITLTPEESGIALVIRRAGRPIGFRLQALAPGTTLTADAVAGLIDGIDGGPPTATHDSDDVATGAPVPTLTAAVCSRNRPEWLLRCVRSLLALQATPLGGRTELEILVVDNAPSDERARAAVAALPGVRYVREACAGLNFARNRAVAEARSTFIAFFDDDVVVDRRWLHGFVEAVHEYPDAVAVSGPVLPLELVTPSQILFERWGGFGHRLTKTRYDGTQAVDPFYPCRSGMFGTGCNMAFRREALHALGGFDEALDTGPPLPGGGDLDIFYRLVRNGATPVVEPQCLVFHQHRRSHRDFRRQMWGWGLGSMAFVAKSYRTDPANRPRLRAHTLHWFRRKVLNVALSAVGRGGRPLDVALVELWGGIVGILGEYSRSQRRVARIRAYQLAAAAAAPAPITPPVAALPPLAQVADAAAPRAGISALSE